jgi:hypothetical protein
MCVSSVGFKRTSETQVLISLLKLLAAMQFYFCCFHCCCMPCFCCFVENVYLALCARTFKSSLIFAFCDLLSVLLLLLLFFFFFWMLCHAKFMCSKSTCQQWRHSAESYFLDMLKRAVPLFDLQVNVSIPAQISPSLPGSRSSVLSLTSFFFFF